jgi:hypothetical protein
MTYSRSFVHSFFTSAIFIVFSLVNGCHIDAYGKLLKKTRVSNNRSDGKASLQQVMKAVYSDAGQGIPAMQNSLNFCMLHYRLNRCSTIRIMIYRKNRDNQEIAA